MRVGIDITGALGPRPTGISRYIVELVSQFQRDDREVVLLARKSRRRRRPEDVFPGREISSWGRGQTRRHLGLDLFHGTDVRVPRAVFSSHPSVATLHDLTALDDVRSDSSFATPRFQRRKIQDYRNAARRCRILITQTPTVAKQIVQALAVPTESVRVIPLASFQSPKSPTLESPSPARPQRLLVVGGPSTRKGADRLPPLLDLWRERWSWEPTIVWVGAAHGDAIERVTAQLSRPEQVEFRGFVPQETLELLYQSEVDGLLFLSDREGFGMPLLEAARAGCPILAIESGAVRDVIGEGATWFHDSLERSAEAFTEFLDAPLRSKRRRFAFEKSMEYSWSRAAAETWRVYEEALDRSR